MFIALLTALILLKNTLEHFNKRRGNKVEFIKEIATTEKTSQFNEKEQLEELKNNVNKMSANQTQQKQQATAKSASASSRSGSGSGAGESAVNANEFSKNVLAFNNSGEQNSCLEIGGKDCHIVGSAGAHDHGSSKVKLKNIVDYKWENKHYPGHLIAVHMDSNHIAYVIVNNKANRMEGMVRVAKLSYGLRALIKGMSGEVLDIQFAHIERERILASIDATALYVHKIEMQCGLLVCNLIVKIDDPIQNYTPKFDKVCWCPFEQDEDDDEDSDDSKLIVWARGSRFQCLNIRTVVNDHGKGTVKVEKLTNGYMLFQDDALTITWINLSPDGTTLSVGSTDGFIRFYQVYMFDKEWRCLHQWKPHNGKPISSFFFLDNLNNKNKAEAYWKYAITCANNNTELKLWDCGTWSCMQTVTIGMKTESTQPLRFIADINRSAEYMVLTCLETRSCYVFQIDNDTTSQNDSAKKTKGKKVVKKISVEPETPVLIKSVAEFPLSSGVLSFSIMDAAVRRYKCGNDSYLCEELDDYDEENNSVICVVVRIIIVQPKSLQECRILYQPSVAEHTELASTLSGSLNSIAPADTTQSTNSNESNDSVDEGGIKDVKTIETQIKKLNPLEVLLGMSATPTTQNDAANDELISQPATVTNAKLPIIQEAAESGNASPLASTNSAHSTNSKGYGGQVNLMTPDSFTTKSPPDAVSTEVLNTILMLANATKQVTPNNNKIIEDTLEKLEAQQSFKAIDQNPNNNTGENIASGGSSPSREVQEIMSLQDYDKSSSSCDDEELLDEQTTTTTKTDDVLAASVDENDQSGGGGGKAATTTWPKVPEAPKTTTTKHSAELQNAANLISQAVNASGGANSHVPPSLGASNASNSNSSNAINGSAEIADVNQKLNELIDLVKQQSVQINSLQSEISDLKKNNTEGQGGNKPMKEFGFKLEVQLSKLLEQYLKRYESEHNKRLAAFMNGRDVQNRELRDCFVQITNQFILTQMGEIMSKVVNIEIQRNLAPMLNAKIDHLQQQIHLDITQKLNAFDLMLKENIGSACKNKSVIDAFGKSVLVGVQGSLQAAFIESMSSTLIPAYEKSSQNMFKQLHDAFSVGIKEFMEQFDGYMNHMRPQQEASDEILNNFNGFRQHVDTILNNQRASINELMCEVRKDVKSLEILLTRQVQDIVRSEIRKGFDHQTVALRSQANTPAPTYDLRETIKHLLVQGQINKAFHQALLANDLNLVEFTLKHADHNAVFTPECVLEQKVLLSLMQQISADMSNHDEVKQSYLADALLAININDPITREHAPKVLNEMYRNCQMFLINFPKNSQCSNVRMLLKAVQSFNKDTF